MLQFNYEYKKDLIRSIGKHLSFFETSIFGPEYKSTGEMYGCNLKRTWFAKVTTKDDVIVKVE